MPSPDPDKRREQSKKYKPQRDAYRRNNRVKCIWMQARVRAAEMGVPFTIELNEVPSVPDMCPVLGTPMQFGSETGRETSPSLDRIVPELGYVPGNVHWISFRANAIRRDATAAELRKVADFFTKIEGNQLWFYALEEMPPTGKALTAWALPLLACPEKRKSMIHGSMKRNRGQYLQFVTVKTVIPFALCVRLVLNSPSIITRSTEYGVVCQSKTAESCAGSGDGTQDSKDPGPNGNG